MSTVAGYNGSVFWEDSSNNNYALHAHEWNLTYEAGEGETTDFTSDGPKTWIPLTTEWSGSLTIRLDAATSVPDLDNTLTNIRLFSYLVEGVTEFGYRGSAFCTSENPSQDVNGLPTCVVNFRGSGVLTIGSIYGLVTVSGITSTAAYNGTYNYLAVVNSRLHFKHASQNCWLGWDLTNWRIEDHATPGSGTDTWVGVTTDTYLSAAAGDYTATGGSAAGDATVIWG